MRYDNDVNNGLSSVYDSLKQEDVDEISIRLDDLVNGYISGTRILFALDINNSQNINLETKANNFKDLMYFLNVYNWVKYYIESYNIPIFLEIDISHMIEKDTEDNIKDINCYRLVVYKK